MRALAFLMFVSLMVSATPTTHAQFGSSEPITISITPEFPRPYDTIVVTPQSNVIDLAASTVTITANGTIVEQGGGARSTAVILGGPGTRTVIRVTAVTGGVTYSTEATLHPADVSLVVEPQTTTHPFYEGGSLVAPEGGVRIVALPDFRSTNGVRLAPSTLSYTWRLGNRILNEESGVGRSVLAATAPVRYRNAEVSVTISSPDNSMAGYATVSVAPVTPLLFAYRDDPLLGLDLSHALSGAFAMSGEEETFRIVPFHFSSEPGISWTLNGDVAGSDRSLTVRTTSATAGSASVSASAQGDGGESARASFTVNFNASRGGGIFGF